jgi:hypothetical protein
MSLKLLVDETTTALTDAIEDYEFSNTQKEVLQSLIEKSIAQAVLQTNETHKEVTVMCCGPEADLAHKIAWEVEQKTKLLISNLSSMR